jgi:hypothetical protein
MTVATCTRCGQLLLPELVREVGGGTTCPFCSAPLPSGQAKPTALAASVAAAPPAPPARPAATPALSPARVTILGHGASVPTPKRAPPEPPRSAPSNDGDDWFRGPEGTARKTSTRKAPEASPVGATPESAKPSPPPTVKPPAPSPRATLVGTPPPAAPAPVAVAAPPPAPIAAPALASPIPRHASVLVARTDDTEAVDWDAPQKKRRRIILAGLGAVTMVALIIGLGARRRAKSAPPPRPVEVAAPARPVAPPPAPPPTEIALDPVGASAPPKGAAAPPAEAPPAPPAPPVAEHAPRARVVHEHAPHEHAQHHVVRRPHQKHARAVALKSAPAASDHGAAHAAYQRGNGALLSGDAAGAIDAYREAVRLAPDDPVGYRGLGLAFEKQGKVDDAVAALRRYLKLAPRSRDRELVVRRLQRLTRPSADEGK